MQDERALPVFLSRPELLPHTAINRLAEGGHLPDMKPIVERYGQRTRLQDLDGLKPLPSGLLSAPRLVLER
jgi:hypothetical protein